MKKVSDKILPAAAIFLKKVTSNGYLINILISTFGILVCLVIRNWLLKYVSVSSGYNFFGLTLNKATYALVEFGNIFLLSLLANKYGKVGVVFITFLYVFSPWTIYLGFAGNVYILLLFLLLFAYYLHTMAPRSSNIKKVGLFGFLLVVVLATYQVFQLNDSFIREVGHVNSVNSFRGILENYGLGPLGVLIENRYIYFLRYLLDSILANFSPSTLFTAQEQMFASFVTPPLLVVNLLPFVYGIFALIKGKQTFNYKVLLLACIPSVISFSSPDLIRLILIFPLIALITTIGFVFMQKSSIHRLVNAIYITFYLFQFLVFLSLVVL